MLLVYLFTSSVVYIIKCWLIYFIVLWVMQNFLINNINQSIIFLSHFDLPWILTVMKFVCLSLMKKSITSQMHPSLVSTMTFSPLNLISLFLFFSIYSITFTLFSYLSLSFLDLTPKFLYLINFIHFYPVQFFFNFECLQFEILILNH